MQIRRYRSDAGDDVYVFSSGLKSVAGHYDLLSPTEKLRAERIGTEVGRFRFIASRSFLRLAIGEFLSTGPYRSEFILGCFGKLYLSRPHSRVCFSVSHTDNVIVVVCASRRVLGVDIERSDREISTSVLRHIYLPEDIEHFSSVHDAARAVLLGWVCKEAVLKCIGSGLARDPRNIALHWKDVNQPSFRAREISQRRLAEREFQMIRIDHIFGAVGAIALHQSTRAQRCANELLEMS
jgi:4'-phosphopantetheinyl transferase